MVKRVPLNISVPTQEEKEEIVQKARSRGESISEIVVAHFRRLQLKKK